MQGAPLFCPKFPANYLLNSAKMIAVAMETFRLSTTSPSLCL